MGIYRVVWRSGMGAVAAVGAVFAVLDLPADVLLALGLCAVVLGASAAAVIRAGTRSALASSGALAASAVAVLGTFAVAGLLALLGFAALLEVGLLGVLSPRMLGRFGVSAPAPAHPGGDRGAEAGNPPPDCSRLSDDQLCMCWRAEIPGFAVGGLRRRWRPVRIRFCRPRPLISRNPYQPGCCGA